MSARRSDPRRDSTAGNKSRPTEASFGCENSPFAGAPQAIVDTVSDKRQLPDRDLAVGLVRVTADHQLSELREFSAIELG
jgi:hypothetical protein